MYNTGAQVYDSVINFIIYARKKYIGWDKVKEREAERERKIGKERENRKRATKLNQIISLVMVSK